MAASIDNATNTIFVSLPEGSDTKQEISFNFPYEAGYIYISRVSGDGLEDESSVKLSSGDTYDFSSFISHLKVRTASGGVFDLWVTTGNVPIITIDSEKDIPDEPKVGCKVSVLSSNPKHFLPAIDGQIELTGISAEIPKSSYSLNIAEDPITGNIPQILDFSPSKRFTLSSSYTDPSLIREKLAADIFSLMGEPSRESGYAELYVDGCYQGLYLLSRRVDREMFSIPNYDPDEDKPGVIYEASGWRADFTRGLEGFSQIEPDYESETPYMDPLEELIDLVMEVPDEEFKEAANDTLDIENTLDSHILYLLSASSNPLSANQYIYRSNGADSRFSFFPGSFYQGSFGRDPYSKKIGSEASFYGTRLFNRLYQEASYRDELRTRYNALREDILTEENLSGLIDKSTAGLSGAWERNSSAWSASASAHDNTMDPGQDVAYIKEYLGKRLAFLDDYINNPPILKIGDSHALINEEANTIFCSLPAGADTVQEVSWDCWDGAEVYIEPVSVGSYTAREEKDPQEMEKAFLENSQTFKGGNPAGEITMWIDQPYEDETITDIATLSGWALNQVSTKGTGVKNVFVFDGPDMDIDNFLGAAVYGNPREDVAEHFKNPAFENSGYSLEIDTALLKNGKHDLYVYAYDSKSDYSLQILRVDVYNGINLSEKDINMQKTKLECNDNYDFVDYVFHGILEIRNGSSSGTYDLWVTTGDLPVVIIDTGNTAIPNYPKINCSFQLLSATDLPNYSTEKIKSTIEVRGGSSAFSDKKSYSFKFDRELSYDVELSLLDMTNARKWILNGCFLDRTFMRDKISYDLFNQMRDERHYDYAAETRFVEVFLNDAYRGIYLLSERVDEDLLELADYNADDELHSVVYKSYGSATSWQRWNLGADGLAYSKVFENQGYLQKEPNPVNASQGNYWEPLLLFREFAIKSGQDYFSKYIGDELDLNNLIDFYLLFLITGNPDGRLNNQYVCRDNSKDSKFFFVPWDYNASFGRNAYTSKHDYTRWYYNCLTDRLLKIESFRNSFKERWNELRKDIFTVENIHEMIEANAGLLEDPQKRNFNRYPIVVGANWQGDQYVDDYDFEDELDYIMMWVDGRIRFLDHYINENLGMKSGIIDDNISIRTTNPGLYSNVDSGFIVEGWAIDDTSFNSPGISEILVYYGGPGSSGQLLGSAKMGLERPGVVEDLENDNYRYSGFEMEIEENILKEGNNFLWVIAFDSRGNYNMDSFCLNYIDD